MIHVCLLSPGEIRAVQLLCASVVTPYYTLQFRFAGVLSSNNFALNGQSLQMARVAFS